MPIRIAVKVIPSAKKSAIIDLGLDNWGRKSLKIKVSQPPEDGKANLMIIEMLAQYFKVKKSNIIIISGWVVAHKIIEIELE
jgi:uncharacterized protein (TIGR00251 family)